MCGNSVPSERIFSTCGYVVNSYRNRLHPKNVDYLVQFVITFNHLLFFFIIIILGNYRDYCDSLGNDNR